MQEKKLVSIDLGSQKLALSVASRKEDGKIKILYYNEFPSEGISHGKVLNPSRLGITIKHAVESAERSLKVKVEEVLVNVQKYDVREISMEASIGMEEGHCIGEADIDNLEELVWSNAKAELEAGEEVFGVVAQSFDADSEWGVNARDIIGMMASRLTGHYKTYIGKMGYRNNIDAAFTAAGINSVKGVFSPDVTGYCVLSSPEMEGGVALIDIGAGASSVSIFHGGALRHYGAIPFGGNNISNDIRNLCSIDERLAENIKLGYGGLLPDRLALLGEKTLKISDISTPGKIEITAKYLSEIITARMREILDALLYEIQESGYADKLRNGIVVCGGCASTLNMCNMIKEISGYNARVGAPERKRFEADSTFFTAAAVASAGLVYRSCTLPLSGCTDEEADVTEVIFSDKKRREEEKRRKKELKEQEKRIKEEERKGHTLFDTLFGSEDDPANKI